MKRIFRTWWPLAGSWMLMSLELPALIAIVARLPEPEINLAAYSGIVFPLALLFESSIIMLLAASTALSKDWASYQLIRRFMMTASAILTGVHILVVYTPLYYLIARDIMGQPEEIIAAGRLGLMIMTPWTWSIAYRRFNQGVLIRFGHSRTIGIGTVVRLSTNVLVLSIGYLAGNIPGVAVATSAVIAGVLSEAIFIGIVVRPVITRQVKIVPPLADPLTWKGFYAFYTPLVLTALMSLLALPIGSAALSRMPQDIESLATWGVISGLMFLFRSPALAYNEVVVALLDEQKSYSNLRRFTAWLAGCTTLAILVFLVTPLTEFWFTSVMYLSPELQILALSSIWLALPLPALAALQSWYQGALLQSHRTRGITEAVVLYLGMNILTLTIGVIWGQVAGIYIGVFSLLISTIAQTAWLGYRGRPALRAAQRRDLGVDSLSSGVMIAE